MKNVFPHRQRISSMETKNGNFETSCKISSIKKRATDSVAYCNIICSSYDSVMPRLLHTLMQIFRLAFQSLTNLQFNMFQLNNLSLPDIYFLPCFKLLIYRYGKSTIMSPCFLYIYCFYIQYSP